jgi:hypothetical protein
VAHAAADQREDDVFALVEGLERPDAERGRVVGDEENGTQACLNVLACSAL